MNWSNRPAWLFPVIASIACVIIAVAAFLYAGGQRGTAAPGVRESGQALIGGPFELVAHTGETVTEADFEGRPMLIYFGFTYCPDVCPMSLQVMAQALNELPADQRAEFQPLLISLDPERDTPEALAAYVETPVFPEGLLGLTGSPEQIAAAARAYRVYYARAEADASMAEYLIDHSSLIYLMDRQGRFVEVFPHATAPERIAQSLQRFLQEDGA
ncbi:MAG: SCO family protein [Caulobacterales bacterium]|uniref:SCO family protein n=1 Tax=Glycocaulis sp. TaxID=1969725 RepID=UPI003FA0A3CD